LLARNSNREILLVSIEQPWHVHPSANARLTQALNGNRDYRTIGRLEMRWVVIEHGPENFVGQLSRRKVNAAVSEDNCRFHVTVCRQTKRDGRHVGAVAIYFGRLASATVFLRGSIRRRVSPDFHSPVVFFQAARFGKIFLSKGKLEVAADFLATLNAEPCGGYGFNSFGRDFRLASGTESMLF